MSSYNQSTTSECALKLINLLTVGVLVFHGTDRFIHVRTQ